MLNNRLRTMKCLSVLTCFIALNSHAGDRPDPRRIKDTVDAIIQPLQAQYGIPGMAVAISVDGENHFYNYGVMSKETQKPITDRTLFEVGSFSKTFAATLASYARVSGKLSLSERVSTYLPALGGSSFDTISLLNLATHTSGLPLFVPDDISDDAQLFEYLKRWQPPHPAGSHRIYSNLGVGLLGMIAARRMGVSYDNAIEQKLFPELGMTHSYLQVPPGQMRQYAQGYTAKDAPIRMKPGVLASQAYGVRSCAADLIRFIDANMQLIKLDGRLQRAIDDTHIGYFRSGPLVQDLIWEQYPYPTDLQRVLSGNAATLVDAAASQLSPPLAPRDEVMINKTGSTNGFSTYVAFVPARKIGIVILANKSYPIDERVRAADRILKKLDQRPAGMR